MNNKAKTKTRALSINLENRFPFVAAEILSSNNDITYKYLLEEVVFIEEEVE